MKTVAALICLSVGLLLISAKVHKAAATLEDDFQRGVVIEAVACQSDSQQNYALYLPSNYTSEKKWAVLYAFDPAGRGKTPVSLFQEAAEKYGFILVGSNNSRNGLSGAALAQIINTLWNDTHARFNLDKKRVYATGFSGGARVANSLANSCRGCMAGVISSGGGFSADAPASKTLPYVFFGAVGVDDFNYPELRMIDKTLDEFSVSHRVAVFEGEHQWLSRELTFQALEWLNLHAMKTGRMPLNPQFVADYFSRENARAEDLEKAGKIFESGQLYKNIVDDFDKIYDTTQVKVKLLKLEGQKEYKEAFKQDREALAKQAETVNKIMTMLAMESSDAISRKEALQKIKVEIDRLKIKTKLTVDSGERRAARRALSQIFVGAYESALYTHQPQKKYGLMVGSLELARLIRPENANVLFNLSRAYALGGEKKESLETLKQAVEGGFNNCKQITGQAEFANLQKEKDFQQIVEKLGCR